MPKQLAGHILEKESKIIKLMCLLFVSLTRLCWQTPKSYINNVYVIPYLGETKYHFSKSGLALYCTHPFNCNTGMDDDRGIPTSFRCESTGRYQHVIGSTYTRYVLSTSLIAWVQAARCSAGHYISFHDRLFTWPHCLRENKNLICWRCIYFMIHSTHLLQTFLYCKSLHNLTTYWFN